MNAKGLTARRVFATMFILIGWALQAIAYLSARAFSGPDSVGAGFLAEKIIVAMIGSSLAICGAILLAGSLRR